MSESEAWKAGNSIRREVLGDDYVDRSYSAASDFTRLMVDYVTEHCWGTVWTREGLDKRTRSLVTLAMLAALQQENEISAHVKGAVRNGCSVSEIQETLLQAMVYCGIPAGINAFKAADKSLREVAEQSGRK
ncbi:4-carboxymuconolactone decarboxylase [Rhizobium lusitanum]|uniref:4-carboxymuconolactone decarboxylase n=1 Tax=Rhizobium lusitanum TaxID=293958 RepID=A0A6L9UEF4_9HYPH|nr:carboxymuconolactone decarboxylase family protein [Rhizobium lusitanum]NEI72420.1 4-carboxymuconolactone decarboxylase [Rhizobium lusitanum]